MYSASNLLLTYYVCYITPSFTTQCLERFTKLQKKLGAVTLDLWTQFHPEQHASAPGLCVGESYTRIISSIPIRRNPDP